MLGVEIRHRALEPRIYHIIRRVSTVRTRQRTANLATRHEENENESRTVQSLQVQ